MWSTGEGNGKPLQYSCLENPMNSMNSQKDRTLKDELPLSGFACVSVCNIECLQIVVHFVFQYFVQSLGLFYL